MTNDSWRMTKTQWRMIHDEWRKPNDEWSMTNHWNLIMNDELYLLLKGWNESAELFGKTIALLYESAEILLIYVAQLRRNLQLTSHLAKRTFGDIQKLNEFSFWPSLKSLGDITRNRDWRSTNLIHQTIIPAEFRIFRDPVYFNRQVLGKSPDRHVLESFIHRHIRYPSSVIVHSSCFSCHPSCLLCCSPCFIRHPSLFIRHSWSVIRHAFSVIRHALPVIRHCSFVMPSLLFVMLYPSFVILHSSCF